MSEVTFAKQFLATLDSKPQKLSSDHVADPKKLPAQPAFILPRMSKPFPKPSDSTQSPTTTASSQQIKVTLSPLRKTADSPKPVKINIQPKVSIYDLKTQLSTQTGYATDKLKILWGRRPVTDSKTIAEVVGEEASTAEFAVMYTGSPTASSNAPSETFPDSSTPASATTALPAGNVDVDKTPVAQGPSGKAVLDSAEFWKDLQDFVLQRVREETVSKEAVAAFEKAWKST